jgi:hypothetical protein
MASANTCQCISFILILKMVFQKKNHRGRSFFFSSRKLTQGLGRLRSLDCGRIRTPLRFRVGAWARAPADASGQLCLPGGPLRWWWWWSIFL